jgi:hypothetical protein
MTPIPPTSLPMPASPSADDAPAPERMEGAHLHLGKAHEILARCHRAAALGLRTSLRDSQQGIRRSLEQHGISFEGKRLLVSLTPTLLAGAEIDQLAPRGGRIRAALLAVIDRFVGEHRDAPALAASSAPLHRFFAPYARWWELIAAERRRSEAIQLMRYDAIREDRGRWRLLETNTCCPGGTIHCARVRTAWLSSPLGSEATRGIPLAEHPVDRPDGFLRHLNELARQLGGRGARVGICSYRGSYQNEVASLAAEQRRLVEQGELEGGELVIGDARELECDGRGATLRGLRVDLVYNKLDPLMIEPGDPELAGWARAAASPHVEFLNSLGAMYLTETKRVLALLGDEPLRHQLGLDAETLAAIDELVPRSHVLPQPGEADVRSADIMAELLANRHRYVLKADASTRGAGIFVGRELGPQAWAAALDATVASHGIAQECADIPRRIALDPDAEGEPLQEYWGVDLFYFGDRFGGTVSRCHTNMVFNVGNGGKESPALVVT